MINQNYYFHGFAGNQISGDPYFFDLACGNNGTLGANLSNVNAWANAGYISTVAPSSNDTAIHIPELNFDYSGGQSMFFWWLGQLAAPGSTTDFGGDGFGTSKPGIRIRAFNDGGFDFVLSDANGQKFISESTGLPFDNTIHSFAFCIDGAKRAYGVWVDELYDANLPSGLQINNSGANVDTRTNNTFNIGQAASTSSGQAVKTRALVMARISSKIPLPSAGVLTNVFKQLRANPGAPINVGAF